jgi:hypothetical protein
MKKSNWLLVLLFTAALALVSCSKAPPPQKTQKINGVDVAMPELQQVLLDNKDKDVQNGLGQIAFGLRYGDLPAAQKALDALAANPTLNDAAKKLVAQVADQLKQAASAPPPQPGK